MTAFGPEAAVVGIHRQWQLSGDGQPYTLTSSKPAENDRFTRSGLCLHR
jgi:hypothetical protein